MSHVEFNLPESSERRPSATSTTAGNAQDAPPPAKRRRFSTPAPAAPRTQQLLSTAALSHSLVPPTRAPIAWSQSEQLMLLPVPGGVLLRTLPRDAAASSQQSQQQPQPASRSHLLRSFGPRPATSAPRPTLISISPSSRVILAAFPTSLPSLTNLLTDEHICLWLRGASGALNDWTEIHLPWAAHSHSSLRHVAWCDAPRQWHHASTDTAESQKLRVNGQAMPFTRAAAGGARLPIGTAASRHQHGAEAAVLFGDYGDVSLIYRTSVSTPFVTIRTTLASAQLALAPSMGLFTEVPQDCTFLGSSRVDALAVGAVTDEATLLVAYTIKPDNPLCFEDSRHASAGKASMNAPAPSKPAAKHDEKQQPPASPPPDKDESVNLIRALAGNATTGVNAGAERSCIRLCEVRVGLGLGADGSGVFISTRPLAPIPVAPPGSGRALTLPTQLSWRAAPRYDTPDGSSMLRLICAFSLPGMQGDEATQAQLRTWQVSRVYSPLSNAFASLESKRATLPASTLEWVVRPAAQRSVRGASVTSFAPSSESDAFGAILEETDEDGKPCWASWVLYDVSTLEPLPTSAGRLPLGTQYGEIVLSPNATLAAGFDLRGAAAKLDIFPAPRRVLEEAAPIEQAGRDLALSLLRCTGTADVARLHLRSVDVALTKAALLKAASVLGLAAPSLHEALRLLQLNAALWQHQAERVRIVLQLARISQAFRAAELRSTTAAQATYRIADLARLPAMLNWLLALLGSIVRDAILLDATHDLPTPPAAADDAGPTSSATAASSTNLATGALLALFALRIPRLLLIDALSRALILCLWLRDTQDGARRSAVLADRAQRRPAVAAQAAVAVPESNERVKLLPSEELDLARAKADDAIAACGVDLKKALQSVKSFQSSLTHDPTWWADPGLAQCTEEQIAASRALAQALLASSSSSGVASSASNCVRDALALLIRPQDVLGETDALAPRQREAGGAGEERGAKVCAACGAWEEGFEALECVCGGGWWVV